MPETYFKVVQDMYDGVNTQIRSNVGTTEKFTLKVGLHQGSSLRPYLCDMIMDVATQEVKDIPTWCMLFADDIVLYKVDRGVVERNLEAWKRED